jgi:hypothetical protein
VGLKGVTGVAYPARLVAATRRLVTARQQRPLPVTVHRFAAVDQTGLAHRADKRRGSAPATNIRLNWRRRRWTPQTLNVWVEDPEALVVGQRRFQVDTPAEGIAYLPRWK